MESYSPARERNRAKKKAGCIISRPHKTNKLKREPDANIVSETDLLSDI